MPASPITPLPAPPLRSQSPTTFSGTAEAFVEAWPNLVTEVNAFIAYLNALALSGVSGSITATALTMATAKLLGRSSGSAGAIEEISIGTGLALAAGVLSADIAAIKPYEYLILAPSDERTALTAGTAKITFRLPYAFTLAHPSGGLPVRASLTEAQTSGSIFTVDVNEGGSSILSTKLTIDNGEKTSVTAATAAVVSDASLADDAEITVDIDQLGDGTAKGLKLVLIGHRT